MGIDGQKQFLYISDVVDFVCHSNFTKKAPMVASMPSAALLDTESTSISRHPCVVIDANQAGMKMMTLSGCPTACIVGIACLFATAGINVIIAADGMLCPQTKIASVMRAADREHARIDAIQAKEELAALYRNGNGPNSKELEKELQ